MGKIIQKLSKSVAVILADIKTSDIMSALFALFSVFAIGAIGRIQEHDYKYLLHD